MARKRTREELERKIEQLQPYEELVFALFRDKACAKRISTVYGPRCIESGEYVFWLYAVDRAAGGVILSADHTMIGYACDVAQLWAATADPYLRDCASQIRRAQSESIQRRTA